MNTCRLHGSPKVSSGPASPMHHSRAQQQPNLDNIDDMPISYNAKENRNAPSPTANTPIIEHKSMTPSRRQQQPQHNQQQNHHQFHLNNDLSSNGCCKSTKNKSIGVTSGGCVAGCMASGGTGTNQHYQQQQQQHHHHHHQQQSQQSTGQQRQPQHPHSTNKTTAEDGCVLHHRWQACPELHKAMDGVNYIADHTKKEEESTKVKFSQIHLSSIFGYLCDIMGQNPQ